MSVRMVPRRSPASIRGIRWTRHAMQTAVVAFIAYTVWAKATGAPVRPPVRPSARSGASRRSSPG